MFKRSYRYINCIFWILDLLIVIIIIIIIIIWGKQTLFMVLERHVILNHMTSNPLGRDYLLAFNIVRVRLCP
jgi:uncharacterized BrkB/YihY/UPF0761 family membrane protein